MSAENVIRFLGLPVRVILGAVLTIILIVVGFFRVAIDPGDFRTPWWDFQDLCKWVWNPIDVI